MGRALFFALMTVLTLGACRRGDEAVVARVGRAVITESEFQRKLTEVAPTYQNYVMTPYGRKQFLDVLVREKLMLQASRADGIASSPEFMDQIRTIRREEEQKVAAARDYLLTKLWLEKLHKRGVLSVTDEDVKDYFRKHPVEVQARHILLPTAEEAEATLNRVRRGASFAMVAEKISLDADTAAVGGLLPPMLSGEVIPELEIIFKMSTGEIGGPVRSKFGYHVLLKESASRPAFETVQERIRNILEKRRLDAHLKTLQASFPVEVVDAQFK
ncbi:MAG: peptidylprolyl isomerase [Elusimicrobiota bacterium]